MKNNKKFYKAIVLMVMLTMLAPSILPISNVKNVQAATIQLSEKSLILNVGETATLKMKGTKKKATWSTSDASIAMVSNSGKVSAIKEGNVQITANISNKKYICKVVILRPENPYIATAPFAAQEKNFGKLSAVIPKDWTCSLDSSEVNELSSTIYPSSVNTEDPHSEIYIYVNNDGTPAEAYSDLKAYCTETYTVEKIKEDYSIKDWELTVSQPVISDFVTTLGTACKVEYTSTYTKGTDAFTIKYCYYKIEFDTYYVNVMITDIGDNLTPNLNQVAEYFLNSIQINK